MEPSLVPAAAPQAAIAGRKAALVKTYGLLSVADADAAWTADELERVQTAFALIPAADRPALAGVRLVRTHAFGPQHSAEFSVQADAVDPVHPRAAYQATTISVADTTFMDTDGMPTPTGEQVRILVHEVGHAVAHKVQRDADLADRRALVALNATIVALNQSIGALDQAVDDFNDLLRGYAAAADAQPGGYGGQSQESKAAVIVVARQKLDALQTVVEARRGVTRAAQARRDATAAAVDLRLRSGPNAVHRFVALVKVYNIPPLTPYAQQNWPLNPEEAFAEAYSIWRTRPAELRDRARPLFDWFGIGRYRD